MRRPQGITVGVGGFRLLYDRLKLLSFFVVLLMLAVPYAMVSDADAAGDEYWSYTLNYDSSQMSVSNGSPLSYGEGMEGMSPVDNTSSALGTVTSTGSWDYGSGNAFVDSTFYGVFTDEGELYKVLNPDDLTEYADGTDASADIKTMNVLWCVPTIYWKSTATTLTITNDPNAGGVAYAHTIDGHVYDYLGYGVYEGRPMDEFPVSPWVPGNALVSCGGDSEESARERVVDALRRLMDEAAGGDALAVAHGSIITLFKTTMEPYARCDQDVKLANCCILTFDYDQATQTFANTSIVNVAEPGALER